MIQTSLLLWTFLVHENVSLDMAISSFTYVTRLPLAIFFIWCSRIIEYKAKSVSMINSTVVWSSVSLRTTYDSRSSHGPVSYFLSSRYSGQSFNTCSAVCLPIHMSMVRNRWILGICLARHLCRVLGRNMLLCLFLAWVETSVQGERIVLMLLLVCLRDD